MAENHCQCCHYCKDYIRRLEERLQILTEDVTVPSNSVTTQADRHPRSDRKRKREDSQDFRAYDPTARKTIKTNPEWMQLAKELVQKTPNANVWTTELQALNLLPILEDGALIKSLERTIHSNTLPKSGGHDEMLRHLKPPRIKLTWPKPISRYFWYYQPVSSSPIEKAL